MSSTVIYFAICLVHFKWKTSLTSDICCLYIGVWWMWSWRPHAALWWLWPWLPSGVFGSSYGYCAAGGVVLPRLYLVKLSPLSRRGNTFVRWYLQKWQVTKLYFTEGNGSLIEEPEFDVRCLFRGQGKLFCLCGPEVCVFGLLQISGVQI
jgi:hypothetical protein